MDDSFLGAGGGTVEMNEGDLKLEDFLNPTDDCELQMDELRDSQFGASMSMMHSDPLNQDLRSLGLPPIKSPAQLAPDVTDVLRTLISQRRKDMTIREQTNDKIQRLESDNETQMGTIRRLKDNLEAVERECAQLQVKLESQAAEHVRAISRVQNERDQIQKDFQRLAQKDSQYQHEVRRKEREFTKLKEQLHNRAQGTQSSRIEVINKERGSAGRAQWQQSSKGSEALEQKAIQAAFEREKHAINENQRLRHLLEELRDTVDTNVKALQDHGLIADGEHEKEVLKENVSDGQLQLPWELLHEPVLCVLRPKIDMVERALEKLLREEDSDDNDIELLRTRLNEYRRVCSEQKQLLEFAIMAETTATGPSAGSSSVAASPVAAFGIRMATPFRASRIGVGGADFFKTPKQLNTLGTQSFVREERQHITEERSLLDEQRESLRCERETLVQQAAELDRMRKDFQKERMEWKQEQIQEIMRAAEE